MNFLRVQSVAAPHAPEGLDKSKEDDTRWISNEQLLDEIQDEINELWAKPGLGVLKHDPGLEGHVEHLQYRWSLYTQQKKAIEGAEGSLDQFSRGYDRFGFTKDEEDGTITYREWIPSAKEASLVGEFNNWDTNAHKMAKGKFGVFCVQLPAGAIPHGSKVMVRVRAANGWRDLIPAWIRRACQDLSRGHQFYGTYWDPPARATFRGFQAPSPARPNTPRIYEAHVGMSSEEPVVNNYLSFARDVLPRIKAEGYNTVQLMAVMEHAYYGSFGYHVTNPFAVSSRSGTPDEFKVLVERAHELGLRVILDVVHSHISCNKNDGLNGFDFGQPADQQYFHAGPKGYHQLWDSRLFNYANWEVLRYLLSNLRWWMDEYNLDGFRFDGVTSMLYHHHGLNRSFSGDYGEYMSLGSDVESAVYLMLANDMLHELYPEVTTIAEDVSGLPTLCRPVAEGGIGFDYRMHMGIPDMWVKLLSGPADEQWSMQYIVSQLCLRRVGLEKTIAYTECHDQSIVGSNPIAYLLIGSEPKDAMFGSRGAESHDQSIVGSNPIAFRLMGESMKHSMSVDLSRRPPVTIERGLALHKMIRLITMALGGEGYLNFMGNEFGHPDWVDFPREGNGYSHDFCRRKWYLADNHLSYHRFLLRWDCAMHTLEENFQFMTAGHLWCSSHHESDKVIVVERDELVFVFNFHPTNDYFDYKVGAPEGGNYKIVLDSDASIVGGQGRVPHHKSLTTQPEGIPGNSKTNFNGRCFAFILPVLPARTCQVYTRTTNRTTDSGVFDSLE